MAAIRIPGSVLLWACLAGAGSIPADSPSVTGRIHVLLMEGRESAGNGSLERRASLDRLAERRAEQVAARPRSRRLQNEEPVGLSISGDPHLYRRTEERLILLKGAPPVEGVLKEWKGYASAWKSLTEGKWDAVGYGTTRAEDGWLVFIAILARDLKVRKGPREIDRAERFVFDKVNEIRKESRLPVLELSSQLSKAARGHSREMAASGRFAHEGIGGTTPADRVEAAGISYRGLAENITMNNNPDAAVLQAVRDWMNSPGHRKNILDPRFRITGVGVAVTDDGKYYFTQLFLFR